MAKKEDPSLAVVRGIIANSRRQIDAVRPASDDNADGDDGVGAAPQPHSWHSSPRAKDPGTIDSAVLAWCAGLDHSDTDNARRLIAHFGEDLLVLAQEKARANLFIAWTGSHWNMATGNPMSLAIAQQVGERIAEEVECLTMTDAEKKAVDRAARAREKAEEDRTAPEKRLIGIAEKIEERFAKRCGQRIAFGVSSKNNSRLAAMLTCAAPHLLKDPDAFNSDPLRVAVRGHTLRFSLTSEKVLNPEIERDDAPIDAPEYIVQTRHTVTASKGHRREDLITEVIPVDYKPKVTCAKFLAFLEEFLPNPKVRRLVQVAAGLGLLGVTVQKLFFHYGDGANGKSVFLETIVRVLGDNAVTLPAESFFGASGQSGGATPDIARLHGRRFLRVQELPEGQDLREDLVKKLTGGEDIPVRDLFQGYFDFRPIFVGHMSGNGYPKISGTDNGIWRRMAVIKWPVTIAESRQRNFEDVVSEFEPEYPGILNWLIEGALIYLTEGLQIPEDVTVETQKFRDEMDPTAAFVARCIKVDPSSEISARELYQGFESWALDAAVKPISETRFGKIMGKKYQREDGRTRRYLGIQLQNVPARQTSRDYPEGYGGAD